MKDLQTKGTGNSRYLKSAIAAAATWEEARAMLLNGTFPIDLAGINEAGILQLGDALNKATLLRDETAAMFGLGADAVPDDVFVELAAPDDLHTLVLQKITKSCTWTAPKAKGQEFTIFAVGGGGGSNGRGGGGGGYVEKAVVTIAEGTSVTVTCGAGGTPSANAGKSSFGSYVSANGGGRATSDTGAAGGAGGGGAYGSAGGAGSTYGGGGGGSYSGAGGAGGTYGGAGGKAKNGGDSPVTAIPSLFTFHQLSHNFNTSGGKGGTGGAGGGGGGGGYGGNGGNSYTSSGTYGGGGGGGYGGNGGAGGVTGGGGGGGGGFFGNGASGTNSYGGGGGGFFSDGSTSSTSPAGGYGGNGGVLVMFFKED